MAFRDYEVATKSWNMYLKLSKKGPYSHSIRIKPIRKEEVDNAISHDEKVIETIESMIGDDLLERIEEVNRQYEQIKDTDEWKELIEADTKLVHYNIMKHMYNKGKTILLDVEEEIDGILEENFVSKYRKIIERNKYYEFYKKYQAFCSKYREEMEVLQLVEAIENEISILKQFCLTNPSCFSKRRK